MVRTHCGAPHQASLPWMQPASASPGLRFAHSSGHRSRGWLVTQVHVWVPDSGFCPFSKRHPAPGADTAPRVRESQRKSAQWPLGLVCLSPLQNSGTWAGTAPQILRLGPTDFSRVSPAGTLGASRTRLERLLQPHELSEGHSRKTRRGSH